MPDFSPNLQLPYLLSSQNQKHLVLNESLLKLDNLVMMKILSNLVTEPPNSPQDGDKYIIPSNANGEWQGKTNKIAVFNNLTWDYIYPNNGFLAYLENEKQYLSFFDNLWNYLPIQNSIFQNLPMIGIGTNADQNNPISAKINNALFSAKYINENGNGNIKYILNKETTSKTASFIFQNNWSGRAEFGLIGDDNFAFKTSVDGNVWQSAFSIDINNARTNFVGINLPEITDGQNDYIKTANDTLLKCPRANNTHGNNIFIGKNCGSNILNSNGTVWSASDNIAIGCNNANNMTSGFSNISIGTESFKSNTIGVMNTIIGVAAMRDNISGSYNSAFGRESLILNQNGDANCAYGIGALASNISGSFNTAIGVDSLRFKTDGSVNENFSACVGIGQNTRVSASYQIQLGSSGTTTYAFGSVQDRSDLRDKTEIRDTILGLDFINSLRPVDFKWDMRDDYFETIVEIDENGNKITNHIPIPKDGSKKRGRFHHGLIAQELAQTIKNQGIDFGGYQDHSLKGGCDVQSIGYSELIAPLIKAVQELSEKITYLESQIVQNT